MNKISFRKLATINLPQVLELALEEAKVYFALFSIVYLSRNWEVTLMPRIMHEEIVNREGSFSQELIAIVLKKLMH